MSRKDKCRDRKRGDSTTDRADEHWEETDRSVSFLGKLLETGRCSHSLVSSQQIVLFRRVKLGVDKVLA